MFDLKENYYIIYLSLSDITVFIIYLSEIKIKRIFKIFSSRECEGERKRKQ
jgi:hypothetical protein